MSILLNVPAVVSPPASVRLTTTSITDIVTAVDANSVVLAIMVSNETAGAVNILISRFDGTTDWNTYAKPVPANDSVLLADFPIRGLTGHKIKATASAANALTVSVIIGTVAGRNVAGNAGYAA